MESWKVRILTPGLLVMMIGLSGCRASWSFDKPTTSEDTAQFMTLWRTYSHCRSSSDPEEMRTDAERLDREVQAITLKTHASMRLPDILADLVSELPSRLAIDPKAMLVACSLYAGQAAQALGQRQLAAEMFTSITTTDPEYGYYVEQAKQGLRQLEKDTHVVMDTSEQGFQIVSER
jgi:hypothetical protein